MCLHLEMHLRALLVLDYKVYDGSFLLGNGLVLSGSLLVCHARCRRSPFKRGFRSSQCSASALVDGSEVLAEANNLYVASYSGACTQHGMPRKSVQAVIRLGSRSQHKKSSKEAVGKFLNEHGCVPAKLRAGVEYLFSKPCKPLHAEASQVVAT